MAFYGYKGDVDNCYWTPYSTTYDSGFAPNLVQASSPYEFGEPELIRVDPSAYSRDDSSSYIYTYSDPNILQYDPIESHHSSYNYYGYSVNPSYVMYSQPNLLQYEPPPSDQFCYFPSETKFTISYSTVEFNEPEFEDYDPTPYGGGYDPSTTYGKPLPPSDAICYPRSVPQTDSMSLENFSYASIPSPYGKDDDLSTKAPNGSKPADAEPQLPTVENGDKVASEGADVETVEPSDAIPSNDSPAYEHQNGSENGTRGDYGCESDGQVTHIPYGSGLETLDLCDSIFGYWPCLAKRERTKYRAVCNQERRMDPLESAVDYLFGSPMVYDYENYHHHHHQGQYECYENSWL